MANQHERRFRKLYEQEFRALLGYALRRVTQPADAADVVADTFLVAWRRLDEVPPGNEARLWLYGVARRVLANHHRGSARRDRLGERLRSDLAACLPQQWDTAAPVRDIVHTAMARLDPDDRELLRLTNWEGLKPADVATAMELSPGTVRARLYRARQRMRAELEALGWWDERSPRAGHVIGSGSRIPQPTKEAQ